MGITYTPTAVLYDRGAMRNTNELTKWAQSLVDMYTPNPWKAKAECSGFGRRLGVYAWQEEDGRRVKDKELRPFSVADLNDAEIGDRIREFLQDL